MIKQDTFSGKLMPFKNENEITVPSCTVKVLPFLTIGLR